MQVSSSSSSQMAQSNTHNIKTNFTQKISQEEATELKIQVMENANAFALKSTNVQGALTSQKIDFEEAYSSFQSFLKEVGYENFSDKPIAELSEDEAAALVADDGIFGITQTSQRIANFVIDGAAGDESRLRAGREGMLEGFRMAEEMWGGKLPEISQKTMQAATEMVDKAMSDLGFSILNQEV